MNAPAALGRTSNKVQYAHAGSTWLFAVTTVAALIYGWQIRDEYYLSAKHGAGYALGIVGGSMMLLLLLYPLRKRVSFMARWLPIRHWFRTHMIFGVLGPVCILYHCNFRLGAANSNAALLCMGLMVGSGLIGRYIYGKLHYGLYGQRATLQQLQQHMQTLEQSLRARSEVSGRSELAERLRELEIFVLRQRSLAGKIALLARIGARIRTERAWADAQIFTRERDPAGAMRAQLETFFAVIRRIAGIGFYERLFSLWHVLHMPIFFMLVVTGLIHVYAVHLY